MPLFGLGVLILWLGWFGFNPGSTLSALDGRFPEVAARHAAGRRRRRARPRSSPRCWKTKTIDIGMAGNGAIAALVAHHRARRATSSRGPAPIIGARRRRDRPARRLRDRQEDRRPGRRARRRTASRGIWGTLACGLFTAPRLAEYNGFGDARPDLHGLVPPARRPGAGRRRRCSRSCSSLSYATFWAIKKTYGLRVSRRGGGRRPGHLRARHVRLPGAVHPGARARRLRGRARAGRVTSRAGARPPGRCRQHEEDRGVHPPRGVRADPHGAARARLPLALDLGGQGVGPPEGDHRALPRRGADELPAAEGQARVRGRDAATCRRWSTRSSSTRGPARSATGRCSSCRSRRPTASAPASPARRRSRPTRSRGAGEVAAMRRSRRAVRRRPRRCGRARRPLVERLRAVHLQMVDAVLAGDGLGARGRAGRRGGGRAGRDRRAAAGRRRSPSPGARADLGALRRYVGDRCRGRPAPVPPGVGGEVPIASGDETIGARAAARRARRARGGSSSCTSRRSPALTEVAVEEAREEVEQNLRGSFLEELRSRPDDGPRRDRAPRGPARLRPARAARSCCAPS